MDVLLNCPSCKTTITLGDYFCPHCGKKLKDPPPSTSFAKQLSVYSMSLFLPPFGVIPAVKYIRQNDSKSKKIGFMALFLTIISLIISFLITANFIRSINRQLQNQQNIYKDVGL